MKYKVDHITINVKNLEKSCQFYQKILGMEYAGMISMGDHELTYLKITDDMSLELITYKENTGEKQIQGTEKGVFRHLAFETDDIRELFEQLKMEENIIIRMKPEFVEKLKSWRMLIEDPNGVELEFIEY